MAGPFREKILGVLVKVETTSGVDAVPTASVNAIRVVGIPTLEYDFMESGDRDDEQTGILSAPDRAAPSGAYGRITVAVRATGAGAVYSGTVKPPADALHRISGLGVTTDFTGGAEFYRYTTIDSGMETGTLYFYSANKLFKMVGAVANLDLTTEVYKFGLLSYTITGKITSITEAALPALTFFGAIPPEFHSVATAIGSWTQASGEPLLLLSAAIHLGNVSADISGAGATDGLVGWLITDRKATQDLSYNVAALSTFDPFGAAAASGIAPLLTAWAIGTTQYNRIKVDARWSPKPPREGSRNGIKTYQQSGDCKVGAGLTGGREVQLTYS